MVLTDNQIERYSRQIIVPGVGGHAQERLLASCVAIMAAPADAAGALAYLAGAGVGRIVMHPVGDRALYGAMVERTRDLNPEVRVVVACAEVAERCDLMLALIGDAPTATAAAACVAREGRCGAAIFARLDTPGSIAVMPAPPPCPRCAEADLLTPPGARAASAGVIVMLAVAEAFKALAGFGGERLEATLIEFDGYASRTRALYGRRHASGGAGRTGCVCEAAS